MNITELLPKDSKPAFALYIEVDEMPVQAFVAQRASAHNCKHQNQDTGTLLLLLEEDLERSNTLNLCTLAMDVFFLSCLSVCLGFKIHAAMQSKFASKMDELPTHYARLWQAAYDEFEDAVIRVD